MTLHGGFLRFGYPHRGHLWRILFLPVSCTGSTAFPKPLQFTQYRFLLLCLAPCGFYFPVFEGFGILPSYDMVSLQPLLWCICHAAKFRFLRKARLLTLLFWTVFGEQDKTGLKLSTHSIPMFHGMGMSVIAWAVSGFIFPAFPSLMDLPLSSLLYFTRDAD